MALTNYEPPKAEAIPEAVLWKRMVLERLYDAIAFKTSYYLTGYPHEANVCQRSYQASIIALYTIMEPKLNKKDVKLLEPFKQFVNSDNYQISKLIKIPALNRVLDVLNKSIETLGITKIEIPQDDPRHLFKRG